MKNRGIILIIFFISLLINGCENELLTDIQKSDVVTATQSEELVMLTIWFVGDGAVSISSESIGLREIFSTETFFVRQGEKITLSSGSLIEWRPRGEQGTMANPFEYEVYSENFEEVIEAVFQTSLVAQVKGGGILLVCANGDDYYEVTANNSKHLFVPIESSVHISADNNGCELHRLTLNGSDILGDIPGDFIVDQNGMNIYAEFFVFTRYLVIKEITNLSNDVYEIRLDGYESRDGGYDMDFFTYNGGDCVSEGYVQHTGLHGYIKNNGYKYLYVEIDFDGDRKNFVVSPYDTVDLSLMSDNYLEGRLVNLTISVSDKRY